MSTKKTSVKAATTKPTTEKSTFDDLGELLGKMGHTGPVHIALPNTSKEKMNAIGSLAIAVMELSKALNSTQVDVTVSNNVMHGGLTMDAGDE